MKIVSSAFNFENNPDFNEKEYWPRAGYEPFFRELCKAKESIILPIMQGILQYLKCDPYSYDKKYNYHGHNKTIT